MALRAIFFCVSVLLGLGVVFAAGLDEDVYLLIGAGLGALLGGILIAVEQFLQCVTSTVAIGGFVGLSVGIVLAGILIFSVSQIFPDATLATQFGSITLLIVFPYLGLIVGMRAGKSSDIVSVSYTHLTLPTKA